MGNQTWRKFSETVDDKATGLRIKISLTHGGEERIPVLGGEVEYAPTTWIEVALMPNEGEKIAAFAKRVNASEFYKDIVASKGSAALADMQIRKQGIGLRFPRNSYLQEGLPHWETSKIMSVLGSHLHEYSLAPETLQELGTFFDQHTNGDELYSAQAAFQRTKGKSAENAIQ